MVAHGLPEVGDRHTTVTDPTKRPIHYICNLAFMKPRLWERIVLAFLTLEQIDGPAATVWYKVFWDRLYVYRTKFKNQPLPLKSPWTGGVDTPWLN